MKTAWLAGLTVAVVLMAAYMFFGNRESAPAPLTNQEAPRVSRELSKEHRAAAERIRAETESIIPLLDELGEIRPRSPEYLQLRLEMGRRLMDVQMLLAATRAEKLKAINQHVQRLTEMKARLELITDEGGRTSLFFVRLAIAEAEYINASLK